MRTAEPIRPARRLAPFRFETFRGKRTEFFVWVGDPEACIGVVSKQKDGWSATLRGASEFRSAPLTTVPYPRARVRTKLFATRTGAAIGLVVATNKLVYGRKRLDDANFTHYRTPR